MSLALGSTDFEYFVRFEVIITLIRNESGSQTLSAAIPAYTECGKRNKSFGNILKVHRLNLYQFRLQ